LKPYFSKIDFAVCVHKNDKYCAASDLAFAVDATAGADSRSPISEIICPFAPPIKQWHPPVSAISF
jgi:hypothetical protein